MPMDLRQRVLINYNSFYMRSTKQIKIVQLKGSKEMARIIRMADNFNRKRKELFTTINPLNENPVRLELYLGFQ